MKRILTLALVSLGAVALFGCPVYSNSSDQRFCTADGQCWDCPGGNFSSDCVPWQCNSDVDCPAGWTCNLHSCVQSSGGNTCTSPSQCPAGQNCGADNQCHAGDCSTTGCPSGYVCKLTNGTPACVLPSTTDGGTVDTGTPDSGDAGSDAPPFTGCTSDSQCASLGPGAKCLDGMCVAAANQCFDQTQCPNGEVCVQGVCTASCAMGQMCPTGYTCDTTTGVCTGNPNPCNVGDAGMSCPMGLTCVDQHCVSPCGPGNTCPTGEVCVDNGCIPDQLPTFVCNVEGTQDACAVGSICLHHNCYIACNPEAGANACATADVYNICKAVTTSTGTYDVCGSNSNLGNQCNPTQGQNCTSPLICIDGYCR